MSHRSRLIPIALILGVLGLAAFMKDPPVASAGGVSLDIPASVGVWRSERILFCQNEVCGVSVFEREAGTNRACGACSSALGDWSVGEKKLLPASTEIARRLFTASSGRTLLVSVVLSGPEQKSIHRPQQCLPAQGNVIESTGVFEVSRPGGEPLKTMWLGIRSRKAQGNADLGCFVYWFCDGRRETPYHLQRLAWTSMDRLMGRSVARWAYVSIYSIGAPPDAGMRLEIEKFIRALQPELYRSPAAGGGMSATPPP